MVACCWTGIEAVTLFVLLLPAEVHSCPCARSRTMWFSHRPLIHALQAQARLLAAEAQAKFLTNTAAPLPRSLDAATLLPVTRVYGPDFYSSALGGASLMLQLLRLYVADPVASASYLKAAIRCGTAEAARSPTDMSHFP